MWYKARRLLCYAKELALMLLFRLCGPFFRCFCPACRQLWLVSERGTDARDNGYWFYHYLRTAHPEINARYVITADSPDAARIAALGGAVRRGSAEHYLLYYCADYLVGSHVQPSAPDLMVHYHLARSGLRARGRQVFLQHGIIKDEMQWLHRKNLFLDLFVCGAKPEYEYIRSTFSHAPDVVQYLGLARFDHLRCAAPPERMILLMPTWRGSAYPKGEAFLDTAFYRHYQSFLQAPALHDLLERYDFQLVFYPHVELQRELSSFHSDCPRVHLADCTTHDTQQLLQRCALLITDYSSVFFDVAYLGKPVLYDPFDEAEFRRYHYQKGYFDPRRDGFGPVCTSQAELLGQLEHYLAAGMELPELYRQRSAAFFPLRDQHNCQRIFEAIRALR